MTRTIKAIRATAIYLDGEELAKCSVQIPVKNFSEKEIDKAISKAQDKYDYKVIRKSIVKVEIATKMSDTTWWDNCDIVSEMETEKVDEENDGEENDGEDIEE